MGVDPLILAKLLGTVPDELKREVDFVIDRYMATAQGYFTQHTLVRPTVGYDLKGHVAGWAKHHTISDTHEMQLNGGLLMGEGREYMLKQTIPHELAHIVQHQVYPNSSAHGYEWQFIMLRIFGLPADRTHSLPTKAARRTKRFAYKASCGCESKVGLNVHKKIQAGFKYTCRYCGGVLIKDTARRIR